jgi:hypothetical protein
MGRSRPQDGVAIVKYADGTDARLGDRVQLWEGSEGRIVCSLDTDEFGEAFPRERWAHLRSGVLVHAETAGLLHYKYPDESLKLLARGDAARR